MLIYVIPFIKINFVINGNTSHVTRDTEKQEKL